MTGHAACEQFVDPEDESMLPDAEFKPNVVNSVIFLLGTTMQTNTFLVNYEGHPFMQSLTENQPLFKAIMGVHALIFCAATEVSQISESVSLFEMSLTHMRLSYGAGV